MLSSKIFQTLPWNFIKGLNESWRKYFPLCIDESEQKESKGSFMLKKPLILQTELIFNEIVKDFKDKKLWIFQKIRKLRP